MKVYKYKSYNEYIKAQKDAYKKKINNIWANEENIKSISEYLKEFNPILGLCHGTRQGYEQKWFMKYLENCIVSGTELGGAVAEHTVEWDFNNENPEWIGKFDFIYSNSFDHSFDPSKTFNIWINQIKHGGHMVLEYDRRQEHTGEISMKCNKVDPVSIKVDELLYLIPSWTKKAGNIEILNMPFVTQEWRIAIIIKVI